MIELAQHDKVYTEQFERHTERGGQQDAAFLRTLRASAFERFCALGFPTTKHEDWRFTNVTPIARTPFQPAQPNGALAEPGPEVLVDPAWPRLVFANGHFDPDASRTRDLPAGVVVAPLAGILAERPELLEEHLARVARYDEHPFTAWNTAFLGDGAVVLVADGVTVPTPIHLLHLARPAPEGPSVAHPRTLVVAGAGSSVTVVERYLGEGDGVYLTNAVSELVVGENATLDHYKIECETESAYHIGATDLHQARDTTARSHTISLGGALVRNNITTVLDGEGAHCSLNGLYQIGGTQHVDNHLRVEHIKPRCDSREFFKGILGGSAHAVFTGRIVVQQEAQKTDAKQTNMNLMLSADARVDSKPQLEIFADDVKCTHGATIGQLVPDAIFYLATRGIDEPAARSILVHAFADEALERIRPAALRAQMERLVAKRLAASRAAERR